MFLPTFLDFRLYSVCNWPLSLNHSLCSCQGAFSGSVSPFPLPAPFPLCLLFPSASLPRLPLSLLPVLLRFRSFPTSGFPSAFRLPFSLCFPIQVSLPFRLSTSVPFSPSPASVFDFPVPSLSTLPVLSNPENDTESFLKHFLLTVFL